MPTAKTEFQERHQDFVFPAFFPTVGGPPPLALQPGETVAGLRFQLDADYPFELRSMAARIDYDVVNITQDGLQFISARWSGPNEDYRQEDFVPLNMLLGPYFGQYGNPRPVFPPVRYPRSGIISIDVRNDGPNPVTGFQLFFRGVKLYPLGSFSETYPEKQARPPLPFLYPLLVPNLAVSDPPRLNQPFAPENDSDFVFRFGQAGLFLSLEIQNVSIVLKDELWKPYSNAPVPASILFGRPLLPPVFPVGAAFVSAVGPGASAPGLIVPEIYIPKNHKIWFDVYRDDAAVGAAPLDYPLTFGGAKVFPA
jgi:hypothetical protein